MLFKYNYKIKQVENIQSYGLSKRSDGTYESYTLNSILSVCTLNLNMIKSISISDTWISVLYTTGLTSSIAFKPKIIQSVRKTVGHFKSRKKYHIGDKVTKCGVNSVIIGLDSEVTDYTEFRVLLISPYTDRNRLDSEKFAIDRSLETIRRILDTSKEFHNEDTSDGITKYYRINKQLYHTKYGRVVKINDY